MDKQHANVRPEILALGTLIETTIDRASDNESGRQGDGWLFVDKRNNPVHVGGDMKAVRLNHDAQDVLNSYIEYHMEFDSLTYQQRYFLEKGR